MKIHLVTLGCVRNMVDTENMQAKLEEKGFAIEQEAKDAQVIVINTCSFIEPAIDESIDTILELAKFKQNGICEQLIVTGCLPERFRTDIIEALPEVDNFLGTGAYDKIIDIIENRQDNEKCLLPDPNLIPLQQEKILNNTNISYLKYIKIAEGCNKHCTYCIIPKLRGKQRSRKPDNIISTAKSIIDKGIKELILVAQDTTNYGIDLDPKQSLGQLTKEIASLSQNIWLRVLYGSPDSIDDDFILTVKNHNNICSYFDLPIQHANNSMLKKMGRNYTNAYLLSLFQKIRATIPDAIIRTTVIIGFPGETEKEFQDLMEFIKQVKFDNLGAFIYSDSEDLPSHNLKNHVPSKKAKDRYNKIMKLQREIASQNNEKHIDKQYKVLLEESPENNLYIGRTWFQAPEVDGITYVKGKNKNLPIGDFVDVIITDVYEYDLMGEVL